MKLRSLVLLSCMVVVPSLAMFSHLIPAEFRAATRSRFAATVKTCVNTWTGTAAAVTDPPAVRASSADAVPSRRTDLTVAEPQTRGTGHSARATPAPPPAAAETSVPQQVAQLADRTRQVRDQQAKDQQLVEKQLESLGAVSFECLPLAGPEGLYSSTCRVPVDATGQLQRVFQASGHDPGSAATALLDQVLTWRQRTALQPPSDRLR